jgi:hypothetical protein
MVRCGCEQRLANQHFLAFILRQEQFLLSANCRKIPYITSSFSAAASAAARAAEVTSAVRSFFSKDFSTVGRFRSSSSGRCAGWRLKHHYHSPVGAPPPNTAAHGRTRQAPCRRDQASSMLSAMGNGRRFLARGIAAFSDQIFEGSTNCGLSAVASGHAGIRRTWQPMLHAKHRAGSQKKQPGLIAPHIAPHVGAVVSHSRA